LASSRSSLNRPDWRDVAVALLELEKLSGGYVVVRLRCGGTQGRPTMHLAAELLADDPNQQVVRTLASASVHSPGSFVGGLETALLSLGYELDRDWYRRIEGIAPHA